MNELAGIEVELIPVCLTVSERPLDSPIGQRDGRLLCSRSGRSTDAGRRERGAETPAPRMDQAFMVTLLR